MAAGLSGGEEGTMWRRKFVLVSLGQDIIILGAQKQSIVNSQSPGLEMMCCESSNIQQLIQPCFLELTLL